MTGPEAIAIKTSHTLGQGAAGVTIYYGFTMNEIGILTGIVSSVAMLAVNFYFQWRRDRREERETQRQQRARR